MLLKLTEYGVCPLIKAFQQRLEADCTEVKSEINIVEHKSLRSYFYICFPYSILELTQYIFQQRLEADYTGGKEITTHVFLKQEVLPHIPYWSLHTTYLFSKD